MLFSKKRYLSLSLRKDTQRYAKIRKERVVSKKPLFWECFDLRLTLATHTTSFKAKEPSRLFNPSFVPQKDLTQKDRKRYPESFFLVLPFAAACTLTPFFLYYPYLFLDFTEKRALDTTPLPLRGVSLPETTPSPFCNPPNPFFFCTTRIGKDTDKAFYRRLFYDLLKRLYPYR